ncbi:hypothetical protein EXIGLDRAFT_684160 [Exidia glandulosa HHB12029]|uniref:UBC core domain-containing protein n=1 Tax=Exidia glandulosa HHB12029 TaxID=1314781 RepID=A0A165CUL8_EXIGL|nr:hypothetical protein EXIGLDRAFT_684160 [Exidia glandulosa HHB12029]
MASRTRDTPAKFYQEDLVRRIDQPQNVAIVLRCWHDSDELPPLANQQSDPLLRPLTKGEVGVSYLPTGKREIAPEGEFQLVDRVFHTGDVCKRSVNDVRCGIVIDVEVAARLFHAVSGQPVAAPVSHSKLRSSVDYFIGDFVLCDDWVGQIEEVFEENTVQVGNGTQLVRLPQLGPAFGVGDRGSDILPAQPQSLLGYLARSLRANNSVHDVVINVVPTVLAITWLAINQKLSNEEAAKRQRPPRFWTSSDLSRLIMVHNRSEEVVRVGERVQFKDVKDAEAAGVAPTEHGKAGDGPGVVKVWDMVVSETQTTVKVMWQDGTIEENISAAELVPYLNVDESEVWPGDHVLWKFEDEQRIGVIQSANAQQRTATVRWYKAADSSEVAPEPTEVVSVLELDPHGHSSDQTDNGGNAEMFGVRRGEFVFIHNDNETNGLELPRVPKIGEVEPWVREASGFEDNNDLQGWRKEMYDLGWRIASSEEIDPTAPRQADPRDVDWFGEVTELRQDGLIEVTLPNFNKVVVPLQRLTLLQDGLDPTVEDMWGDEYDNESADNPDEDMEIEYEDPADADAQSEGSWETLPEEDRDGWADEPEGEAMDVDQSAAAPDVSSPASAPVPTPAPAGVPAPDASSPPLLTPPLASANAAPIELRTPSPLPAAASSSRIPQPTRQSILSGSEDEEAWQRFAVLPSAPPDHAFYGTPAVQPSKSFTSRINKEFRVLSNNLPETILVRSYEDRSDLLRSLIIGPENTPYEDAPFVIDWMLDSDFPQTPPKAHFLSWTNGNGRVNPNLYEEGKVCLSILGTWAGDAAESWSAAKSSLFQVFLSIQGLVLVKEPWYCEPAYDKLRGTVEGTVNSRLYSERAYVLSRGFIRRALEIPLSGLEEEIHWLYYKRGMLEKVLRDARALIEKSKDATDEVEVPSSGVEELAIPRLTAGGVITLSRTLVKLQGLLDANASAVPAVAQ